MRVDQEEGAKGRKPQGIGRRTVNQDRHPQSPSPDQATAPARTKPQPRNQRTAIDPGLRLGEDVAEEDEDEAGRQRRTGWGGAPTWSRLHPLQVRILDPVTRIRIRINLILTRMRKFQAKVRLKQLPPSQGPSGRKRMEQELEPGLGCECNPILMFQTPQMTQPLV